MIPQNCEIIACVLFYCLAKILSYLHPNYTLMHSRKPLTKPLTCIPEKNEDEIKYDDTKKWVPKKKHEALKAKYKCLKKLFQVYDASVIEMLPDPNKEKIHAHDAEKPKHSKRKKRSHLTKTDACSGRDDGRVLSETCIGDVTSSKNKTATDVIKDLTKSSQHDYISSIKNDASNCTDCECRAYTNPMKMPVIVKSERRKLTRFQCLIHRIFGIRKENYQYIVSDVNNYQQPGSDNSHRHDRRRRGRRVTRMRRPKKFISEVVIRDNSPDNIIARVQSVQKSYLSDTTTRQCPFKNCNMILYGIINYNDHINLCHATDRKYICHYCHEGFQREHEKYVHENEHLGITRLSDVTPTTSLNLMKKASVPQIAETAVTDDKIKKIVSFIEKISHNQRLVNEIKNVGRASESNLQTKILKTEYCESEKKTVSYVNLRKGQNRGCSDSDATKSDSTRTVTACVGCPLCGECFDYRGQLSMHMDLEHRTYDKYSTFHSCTGIVNRPRTQPRMGMVSSDGLINVESDSQDTSKMSSTTLTENISFPDQTLSYDQSTNIVYSSTDSLKPKQSFVQKLRAIKYKWEPGTKVIHV